MLRTPRGRAGYQRGWFATQQSRHPRGRTRTQREGRNVPVYVNNTKLLGGPSNGHLQAHNPVPYNFSAVGEGTPICFSKNVSATGCVTLQGVTFHVNSSTVGWNINVMSLGGLGTGLNASLPRDVLPCERPSGIWEHSVPWERCYTNQAVAFPIQGTNSSIINWSVFNKTSWTQGLYEGLWSVAGGPIQLLLWKLAAALNTVTAVVTYPSSDKNKNWTASSWTVNVTACVPEPYALLVGKVNISHQSQTFNVTCVNCLLTNCIANVPWGEQVVVLHQPAFVIVPVNLSEPWYNDHSLQVWREVTSALSRPRRFIGLLIAGVTALITLIATAAAAAAALTQEVQTAHFVNNLSKNVSTALGTQEAIDRKIEEKLNALYDMVMYLGEEIDGLKVRNKLQCHANYQWICVTPQPYNQSVHGWNKVKAHLSGIWHNANESIDLLKLHEEILDLQSTDPLKVDAAETAKDFLNQLMHMVPSTSDLQHVALTVALVGAVVVGLACLLPFLVRRGISALTLLQAGLHEVKLKAGPQGPLHVV
ncbi:endogenous retrovirus group K member 13-1 Env polyprotein-like [Eptesicus fuscus]|uniref:endogenous retrovirus group K member 13-1 Env polyprotein-like n=1 Tax=Eptesicus fuscus TaxID=29078 RepID=UPI002404324A|nr:endogenous retrovirus group K member 13-1 Env polyprotein-like [Eptesicus fuscus]